MAAGEGANESELLVGTLNCRTLKAEWRQGMLARLADEKHMDLVSIQEHHITEIQEDLAYEELGDKWLLACCGADNAGGVGVLLSPRIRDSVKLTRLSERLLRVELNLQQRKMHLFCSYAPTASAEEKERKAFFDELSRHVKKSLELGNLTLALGDFNAPLEMSDDAPYVLSKDNSGRHIKDWNKNTELLQNVLDDRKMLSLNTQFEGTFNDLMTNAAIKKDNEEEKGKPHATTMYAQVDHILIKKDEKWRVRECRTEPLMLFPSDHKMVRCQVKVDKIVPPETKGKCCVFRSQMNWGRFERAFDIALESKLPEAGYDEIEVAAVVACQAVQIAVWKEEAVVKKMDEVRDRQGSKHEREAEWYKKFGSDIDKIKRERENDKKGTDKLYRELCKTYENEYQNKVKSIKQRMQAHTSSESSNRIGMAPMPPSDLTLPPNFQRPRSDNFSIDPIDSWEVQKAAAKLCDTSTSDGIGIPLEAMCVPVLAERIAKVCSSVLEGSAAPEKWLKCDTRRVKRFTSGAARVYNTVLFHRLQPVIEPFLRRARSGSHKAILQHVVQFSANAANITFVELVGGFKSVSVNCLERVLKAYNVPDRLIKGILALYPNRKYVMRQGDDLGPFLSTLLLDWIVKTAMPSDQESQDGLLSLSLDDGLTLMTRSSDASKKLIEQLTDSAKQLEQEVTISENTIQSSTPPSL